MTSNKVPTVKYVTVTEHFTDEELDNITLKDVVNREGFQRVFVNQMRTGEDTTVRLICVQSVQQLNDTNC